MLDDFTRRLEQIGLPACLASYQSGQAVPRSLLRDRAAINGDLGTALDFFCLEQAVDLDTAYKLFGPDIIDLLRGKSLARTEGAFIRLDRLRLVSHFGSLILVGPSGVHHHGYYGADSVGLGAHLLRARGDCLDLFASTGAQSVLMARSARHVVAVEIDAGLAGIFALNMSLNAVEQVTRGIWADALSTDLGGPYDTVSVNAPLLPTFGVNGLQPGADGGFDGHQLLAAILPRLPLREGAAIRATATVLGNEQSPDISWLDRIGRESGLSLRVVPTGMAAVTRDSRFGREYLTILAAAAQRSPQSLYPELAQKWAEMSVDRLFFCIVAGRRSAARAGAELLARTTKGTGWWI